MGPKSKKASSECLVDMSFSMEKWKISFPSNNRVKLYKKSFPYLPDIGVHQIY
jgi:hypothetical protein